MKRIVTIILSVLLIAGATIPSSALNLQHFGIWTVSFVGGDTPEFSIYACNTDEENITIPDDFQGVPVIAVGDHSLMNSNVFRSVVIGANVRSIGESAFLNDTALEHVTLTANVSEIGSGVFSGTGALKDINLQTTSVSKINEHTFLNSGIEEVALPETCTELDSYSFGQCHSLRKIIIPDSVTVIHEKAFYLSENVVIYCTSGSYAHGFAVENEIPFVLTDVMTEVTFILGDADGDGIISVLDATKIQRVLVDLDSDDDGMIALRGNVNDEGVLNVMHATKIQRYIADYTVEEPIGTEVTRIITI